MHLDDLPYRRIRRIAGAIDKSIQMRVAEHEQRLHTIPPPNREPVQAIPFAEQRISDHDLVAIVEKLAVERCDLEACAEAFDYPVLVIERHLAEYGPRYRRFLHQRANGLY